MPRLLDPAIEASFLAYLHYFEDLAGAIGGAYGVEGTLTAGVYDAVSLHPPVFATRPADLDAHALRAVDDALQRAWTRLSALVVAAAVEEPAVDPQLPDVALRAVLAAIDALACATHGGAEDGLTDVDGVQERLEEMSTRIAQCALPYPWSAYCSGCPQLGTVQWSPELSVAGARAGSPLSVFAVPDPDTSVVRFALLLRTTRARQVEQRFAQERRVDVRPGRTRRNLSRELKQRVAESVPPTTLFDVFWRLHTRVEQDPDVLRVGAYHRRDADRFRGALLLVTDATVAALDALIAAEIGWEVFSDLAAAHARRTGAPAAVRRADAAARLAAAYA